MINKQSIIYELFTEEELEDMILNPDPVYEHANEEVDEYIEGFQKLNSASVNRLKSLSNLEVPFLIDQLRQSSEEEFKQLIRKMVDDLLEDHSVIFEILALPDENDEMS